MSGGEEVPTVRKLFVCHWILCHSYRSLLLVSSVIPNPFKKEFVRCLVCSIKFVALRFFLCCRCYFLFGVHEAAVFMWLSAMDYVQLLPLLYSVHPSMCVCVCVDKQKSPAKETSATFL